MFVGDGSSASPVHHLDSVLFSSPLPSNECFSTSEQSSSPSSSINKDFVPTTCVLAGSIQNHPGQRPLSVLFDPGSKQTHFNRSALPKGVVPLQLARPLFSTTAAGPLKTTQAVNLSSLSFPEFGRSLKIGTIQALLFDQPKLSIRCYIGSRFLDSFAA